MDAFSFPSSTVTEAGTAVTWLVPTHRGEGYPPRRTGGLQHAAAALCRVPSDCRHKGRQQKRELQLQIILPKQMLDGTVCPNVAQSHHHC